MSRAIPRPLLTATSAANHPQQSDGTAGTAAAEIPEGRLAR
jgi:hypothetical protein